MGNLCLVIEYDLHVMWSDFSLITTSCFLLSTSHDIPTCMWTAQVQ